MVRLYKNTDCKEVGQAGMIEFLMSQGAEDTACPALQVTVGAIRALLASSKPPATAEELDFLRQELARFAPDEDEDTIVDLYYVV